MLNSTLNKTIFYGVTPGFNSNSNFSITNSGAIYAVTYAVYGSVFMRSANVFNAGHLNASDIAVIFATNADYLSNTGSISGSVAGVDLTPGRMSNSGQISGGTFGVVTEKSSTVQQAQSGHIYGGAVGLYVQTSQITNNGSIGGGTIGVFLDSGYMNNAQPGVVSGKQIGVLQENGVIQNAGEISGASSGAAVGGTGTFYNTGTIAGFVNGFTLFDTHSGALLVNSGQISGFGTGVRLANSSVINGGTLLGGAAGADVYLSKLYNWNQITGSTIGVALEIGYVFNAGNITGSVCGVYERLGSFANGGTVTGGEVGVAVRGGLLIDNGEISGSRYAVEGRGAFELALSSSARLDGAVVDLNGEGQMVLQGSVAGALAGFGTTINGFSTIDISPGAQWTLEGNAAGLASGQTINGFAAGSTLIIDGFAAASDAFVNGAGLVLSDGTQSMTLNVQGSLSTADFAVTNNAGDTIIDAAAPCFCPGTRIATARGNVAVEALQIGDLVKTATQGFQPIRWIGQRAYDGRFIAGNHLALPVKIRRHALGFNVPSRDLFVSPGHAICEGGVLVHAWRLVNGVSITQAERVEKVVYFHIELERHAVIFAENTPVESFLDNGSRAQFANAASAPAAEPQTPCLPVIEEGFYLARLQARIDARAGIAPPAAPGPLRGNIDRTEPRLYGWAQDETAPECPVELELLCAGQPVLRVMANRYRPDLRAAGLGSGCHAFELEVPPLPGPFSLRRVADGAMLGAGHSWMKIAS